MRLRCATTVLGVVLLAGHSFASVARIDWNERGSRPRVYVEKHQPSRSQPTSAVTESVPVSSSVPVAQSAAVVSPEALTRQRERDDFQAQLQAVLDQHAALLAAHEAVDAEWDPAATRLAGLETQLRRWSQANAELAQLREKVERLEQRTGVASYVPVATLEQATHALRVLGAKAREISGRTGRLLRHREESLVALFQSLHLARAEIVEDRSGLGRRAQERVTQRAEEPDRARAISPVDPLQPVRRMVSAPPILLAPHRDSLDWDRLARLRRALQEGATVLATRRQQLAQLKQRLENAASRLRAVDAMEIQRSLTELRARQRTLAALDDALNGETAGYASNMDRVQEDQSALAHRVVVRTPDGSLGDVEARWAARSLPARAIEGAAAKWDSTRAALQDAPMLKLPTGQEVVTWVATGSRDVTLEKLAAKAGPLPAALWNGFTFAKFYPELVQKIVADHGNVVDAAVRRSTYGVEDPPSSTRTASSYSRALEKFAERECWN